MLKLFLNKTQSRISVLAIIIACFILSCFLLKTNRVLENYKTAINYVETTPINQKSTTDDSVVTCYDRSFNDGKRLANVLESNGTLSGGKNIFFHETSCFSNGVLALTARQACAIESAAITNPDWNVFVLFASDVGFRNSSPLLLIDQLLKNSNVQFRSVNVTEYAEGTPLEGWIKGRALYRSHHLVAHLADVLRLLSLYKFGGTHLDMDVVVMKSLNSLKPNFAGTESADYVANGVMSFESHGFGHKFTEMCLSDMSDHFNGDIWNYNGPALITRTWRNLCPQQMPRDQCNFHVLPQNAFYAITWQNHEYFFKEKYADATMAAVKDSILAHVWNKLSYNLKVKVGSNVAYGRLADQYCRNIYRSGFIGEFF